MLGVGPCALRVWGVLRACAHRPPPHSNAQRFHPELYHKEAAVAALPAVQCHPLTHIMDHLGVQHINFYVLDVEGAELLILQSVDFGKVCLPRGEGSDARL